MSRHSFVTGRIRAYSTAGVLGCFSLLGLPQYVYAQQFLGEVMCGGWNFCPIGWAECNGQTLSKVDNDALFQLIGTTYGGDGQPGFALPNIQGRSMLGSGQGAGLSNRQPGEAGGVESVTLTIAQMPSHNHTLLAHSGAERSATPIGRVPGVTPATAPAFANGVSNTQLQAGTLSNAGGTQPHDNLQPYLVVKCCISLSGVVPTPD